MKQQNIYDKILTMLVMLGTIQFLDIVFWCFDHIVVSIK